MSVMTWPPTFYIIISIFFSGTVSYFKPNPDCLYHEWEGLSKILSNFLGLREILHIEHNARRTYQSCIIRVSGGHVPVDSLTAVRFQPTMLTFHGKQCAASKL